MQKTKKCLKSCDMSSKQVKRRAWMRSKTLFFLNWQHTVIYGVWGGSVFLKSRAGQSKTSSVNGTCAHQLNFRALLELANFPNYRSASFFFSLGNPISNSMTCYPNRTHEDHWFDGYIVGALIRVPAHQNLKANCRAGRQTFVDRRNSKALNSARSQQSLDKGLFTEDILKKDS